MSTSAEPFVLRSTKLTGERMQAVLAAFLDLVRRSWPQPEVLTAFAEAQKEPDAQAACGALLGAFDVAFGHYPTAMFWWKNEKSEFLGFCPRFAAASGVAALDLLGRTDADPEVAWSRQAALYMRDDREVLLSAAPRFDIVERQDRGDDTVWLRTSKVPYESLFGSGTVGGFDTISAAEAVRLAKKRG